PELDWNKEKRLRQAVADLVTTLGPTHKDAVLRKAFDAYGLDPQDPRDWRRLLDELASVFFERGRRAKCDERRWGQFKIDNLEVIKILKKKGERVTDAKIAAYLRRRRPYSERYKDDGETALRSYMISGPPVVLRK